jgi:tetratricopeptide (TPR) repeat protein
VFAGPYRVVLGGSRFRLRLDDSRRVYVDAQDGVVEVWDSDRVARLSSGESWASPQPEAAPVPAEPARARTRAAAPAPLDGDAAAQAQAALAAGDAQRALALYRAIAKAGGAAGENAAYEIGKVLRDRLAQPSGAVAAWRRYRSEHPAGVLRVEADVSIIETLAHAGDAGAALAEANDFLRNHPDSERRGEIARVAGDLYRSRGDYKRAVAAYQIALASPHVRDRDDAEPSMFHRAECLVRLGDPDGNEAARSYLRKWPNGRFRSEAERLLESGDGAGAARL